MPREPINEEYIDSIEIDKQNLVEDLSYLSQDEIFSISHEIIAQNPEPLKIELGAQLLMWGRWEKIILVEEEEESLIGESVNPLIRNLNLDEIFTIDGEQEIPEIPDEINTGTTIQRELSTRELMEEYFPYETEESLKRACIQKIYDYAIESIWHDRNRGSMESIGLFAGMDFEQWIQKEIGMSDWMIDGLLGKKSKQYIEKYLGIEVILEKEVIDQEQVITEAPTEALKNIGSGAAEKINEELQVSDIVEWENIVPTWPGGANGRWQGAKERQWSEGVGRKLIKWIVEAGKPSFGKDKPLGVSLKEQMYLALQESQKAMQGLLDTSIEFKESTSNIVDDEKNYLKYLWYLKYQNISNGVLCASYCAKTFGEILWQNNIVYPRALETSIFRDIGSAWEIKENIAETPYFTQTSLADKMEMDVYKELCFAPVGSIVTVQYEHSNYKKKWVTHTLIHVGDGKYRDLKSSQIREYSIDGIWKNKDGQNYFILDGEKYYFVPDSMIHKPNYDAFNNGSQVACKNETPQTIVTYAQELAEKYSISKEYVVEKILDAHPNCNFTQQYDDLSCFICATLAEPLLVSDSIIDFDKIREENQYYDKVFDDYAQANEELWFGDEEPITNTIFLALKNERYADVDNFEKRQLLEESYTFDENTWDIYQELVTHYLDFLPWDIPDGTLLVHVLVALHKRYGRDTILLLQYLKEEQDNLSISTKLKLWSFFISLGLTAPLQVNRLFEGKLPSVFEGLIEEAHKSDIRPTTFGPFQVNLKLAKQILNENETYKNQFWEYLKESEYADNQSDIEAILNGENIDTQKFEQVFFDPKISLFFARVLTADNMQKIKLMLRKIDVNVVNQNDLEISSLFAYNKWLPKTYKAIAQQNLFFLYKMVVPVVGLGQSEKEKQNVFVIDWDIGFWTKQIISDINTYLWSDMTIEDEIISYQEKQYNVWNVMRMQKLFAQLKEDFPVELAFLEYRYSLHYESLKKSYEQQEVELPYTYLYFQNTVPVDVV